MKQNSLKENIHNMLTAITNRASESDKKMFDIEDRSDIRTCFT